MSKRTKRILQAAVILPFFALFVWEFMAYNQRKSLDFLHKHALTGKVIPHEVNTKERLAAILADGLDAVEIDLRFSEENGGLFRIGHDKKSDASLTVDSMLQAMPLNSITKIWLDIKNADADNIGMIRKHLIALDGKFHLKEKLIVESSATDPRIHIVSDEGFHTSYYLPTKPIRLLMEDDDDMARIKKAETIVRQVIEQNLSAISFDYRIYPFIKQYLEPHLPQRIVYHTWDTTIRMIDYNFIDKLGNADYFNDPRVKTLIVVYLERKSLFF